MGVCNDTKCELLPHLVLGIRSSVGILAFPFRPLYSSTSLLSFLLFLQDSHFNCPRMPVVLPFHNCNYLLHFCSFLILPEELHPNQTSILHDRAHQSFISCFFYLLGTRIQVSPQESKGPVSLSANIAYMCFPSQIICNYYSEVFGAFNIFKDSSL